MAMINAAYAGANILSSTVGGYILEALGVNRFFALIASIRFFAGLFLTGRHGSVKNADQNQMKSRMIVQT